MQRVEAESALCEPGMGGGEHEEREASTRIRVHLPPSSYSHCSQGTVPVPESIKREKRVPESEYTFPPPPTATAAKVPVPESIKRKKRVP